MGKNSLSRERFHQYPHTDEGPLRAIDKCRAIGRESLILKFRLPSPGLGP